MSTPEIIADQPPAQPEVKVREEQYIVPETQQQLGITATPQNPAPVVTPTNQVLAQPVVTTPNDPQVFQVPATVAQSEKELEDGAHGDADLARTWYDMQWLRDVHRAVRNGMKVLFGSQTN